MVPVQEEMVQSGLFLLDSEVNNDPQTCPLIHLLSLAIKDSAPRMGYPCERIIMIAIMNNMNKMVNFRFL